MFRKQNKKRPELKLRTLSEKSDFIHVISFIMTKDDLQIMLMKWDLDSTVHITLDHSLHPEVLQGRIY